MTIREYYLKEFPADEMGREINETATFSGLLNNLKKNADVYRYIGVYDSVIRERIFEKLANDINVNYEDVYKLWK